MHRSIAALLAFFVACCLMQGCAARPAHPYIQVADAGTPCTTRANTVAGITTPERPAGAGYVLHFVEFDDQGWLFSDGADPAHPDATPGRHIDCAIADITAQLASKRQVMSFVYVHGWKHSAEPDDRDVQRFRVLLASRAQLFPDRSIVGIYVGWQGRTLDVAGVKELTFWGRKNAADHVAVGRVRELFARIKGLRDHWNGPASGSDPTRDCDAQLSEGDKCALRTILIGHSFGGLILYNSAAPYLLEMLSATRDLPPSVERSRARRARGIADLIVLLNPAFEGSRYESIFQASKSYEPYGREPPILMMITSTADGATGKAFPIARWFNSIFQYPSSSDEESEAMRQTPGHTIRYLTHDLCVEGPDCRAVPSSDTAATADATWSGSRRFCGGLIMRSFASAPFADRSIVWNVRTHGDIIPNHSDIVGKYVYRFVEQVYGDIDGTSGEACSDDYRPPFAQNLDKN